MNNGYKLTEERYKQLDDKLCEICGKGYSARTVANKFKIDKDTIRRILNRNPGASKNKITELWKKVGLEDDLNEEVDFVYVPKSESQSSKKQNQSTEEIDQLRSEGASENNPSSVWQTCSWLSPLIPPDYSNFFGRKDELAEFEQVVKENRVVMLSGVAGVGKDYLAAELAKKLRQQNYQVLWFEEEPTLDNFLALLNDHLKSIGELGFEKAYAENKITQINNKITILLQVINNSSYDFVIFIRNFGRYIGENTPESNSDIQDLIQRFSEFGGNRQKIVLIYRDSDNTLHNILGCTLISKIKKWDLPKFNDNDLREYFHKQLSYSLDYCSDNLDKIISVTSGIPIFVDSAINIIKSYQNSSYLPENLENLMQDRSIKSLLKEVSQTLTDKQNEYLHRLSIFRIPFQHQVCQYLSIPNSVLEALVKKKLIAPIDCNSHEINRIYQEFWWQEYANKEQDKTWHEKAARYYLQLAKELRLDREYRQIYLEASYHYRVIQNDELAAQAVNDLVGRIHREECLPSEKLPGITQWLLALDTDILNNKSWLLLEKGRKLKKKDQLQDADQIFQQVYDLFEQQKEQLGMSVALYYRAKILARSKPQQALILLNKSLDIATTTNHIKMQIRILCKLISCYTDLGKYDNAKEVANEAEKLAHIYNDKIGYALILYRKGSCERKQSNFNEAEELYHQSAISFEDLGDKYKSSKSWSRLGVVQESLGKYDEAKQNLIQAIEIKKQLDDQYGLALDTDYLGNVYRSLGKYEKAIEKYEESLKIKKDKLMDLYGTAKAFNNLARVCLSTFDLPKTQEYLYESQKKLDELKQKNEKYLGLLVVKLLIEGDLRMREYKYKDALYSYRKAELYFGNNRAGLSCESHDYARVLLSLGCCYIEQMDLNLAKKYLSEALKKFKDKETPRHKILAQTNLAKVLALIGRTDEANNLNQEAEEQAKLYAKNLVIYCYENQGLIEEIRILKTVDFNQDLDQNELDKIQIEAVLKYYKLAVESDSDKNIKDIKLKFKIFLWNLKVNMIRRNQLDFKEVSKSLTSITQPFTEEVFSHELLITRNTLKILGSISPGLSKRIAQYSLYILSPLAQQLGIEHKINNELCKEIEELAFKFLYPSECQAINQYIESKFINPKRFLGDLKKYLHNCFDSPKINAKIVARIKSDYSIYRKTKERKGVTLNKILDIIGIRIITQTKVECYEVLNIIKKMGNPFRGEGILAEEERDYIKSPKDGYQSIHINRMIEPDVEKFGEPKPCLVEFQVRTEAMHLEAESGQASHANYKSIKNYSRPSSKRNNKLQQQRRLNLVIECEQNLDNNTDQKQYSVSEISRIIETSKFEVINVDFKNLEDKLIVILELGARAKKRAWDKPEYMEEALSKLQQDIKNNLPKIIFYIKDNYTLISGNDISLEEKSKLIVEFNTKPGNNKTFIYVLTPKGDFKKIEVFTIKDAQGTIEIFPTPIDFAYQIHSELGNHCHQAFVNEKRVPLNTPLKDGDIVRIIQRKDVRPDLKWLKWLEDSKDPAKISLFNSDSIKNYPYVTTPSAYQKIRGFYKKLYSPDMINKGRDLLIQTLGHKTFEALLKSSVIQDVIADFNYASIDTLLAEIGFGSLSSSKVEHQIRKLKAQRGRDSFLRELGIRKKVFEALEKSDLMKNLIQKIGYQDLESFYFQLFDDSYYKNVEITDLIHDLRTEAYRINQSHEIDSYETTRDCNTDTNTIAANGTPIPIRGILFYCAECCKPNYFDDSVGFIKTDGRGVSIHRSNCRDIKNVNSDDRRPILWPVDFEIITVERCGIASDISAYLAHQQISMEEFSSKVISNEHGNKSAKNTPKRARTIISIDVHNNQEIKQLQEIVNQIKVDMKEDVIDIQLLASPTHIKNGEPGR